MPTSTRLELFFDLCFVVTLAALARGLHDEPNLGVMLRYFVPVWWSWMIFHREVSLVLLVLTISEPPEG